MKSPRLFILCQSMPNHYNVSIRITCLTLLALFGSLCSTAQPARVISINDHWQFIRAADTINGRWMPVTIPHSWNTSDVMDDEPGYYRGKGWYKRKLTIPASSKGKEVSLRFEAASQVATLFVNGRQVAHHTGGYNAFQVSISAFLHYDSAVNNNEVVVLVDNSYNEHIAPLTADFTFFGGIYRDVWLVTANPVHFLPDEVFGGTGYKVDVTNVESGTAAVKVISNLRNKSKGKVKLQLTTVVYDMEGRKISSSQAGISMNPSAVHLVTQQLPSVRSPHLWSTTDPYLYTATTTITDARTREILDERTTAVGFRWFSFDAARGFFLNGKPLKLVGASRHQDRPGLGNAVPDALAREDVELLKKMGGNFLRVAHYPQDQSILDACDKLGILTSVEIPLVNEITESEEFTSNSLMMLVEMIRQNYQHPSVVIWCYMNEILLKPHFNNDKPRQKVYFENILKLAKSLDSLTRVEDPSRPTMIANHGDFDRYNSTGLTSVPDIIGWNLYSGWYGGELKNFPAFLDKHHELLPGKPLIVSEYGADADPRIHSFNPVRFDKSIEYATLFHQYYLDEMLKRPFVAGAFVWNLADFNSETREETMPHINNKGLLRWDRKPKAPYYYYMSKLVDKPLVKISSDEWKLRTGVADSGALTCTQPLQAMTNLDSLELLVNGKSIGWKKAEAGIVHWALPYTNGLNRVLVRGQYNNNWIEDNAEIDFRLQPYRLDDQRIPFRSINVLLGAKRYYTDEVKNELWMPDQGYRAGSWGSIGGKPFNQSGNNRMPYGSDKNIINTENDPVYQTQQTGIDSYRFDLPDGNYELVMHFAELRGVAGSNLVYNLSETTKKDEKVERVFDVYVNEMRVLESFNIAAQYGSAAAVEIKQNVSLHNGKGLVIRFKALAGEAVLNAIEVRKLY